MAWRGGRYWALGVSGKEPHGPKDRTPCAQPYARSGSGIHFPSLPSLCPITTTHNRISEVILEAVIIRGLYVVLVCCEL